jgi:hypothetical protein
MAVKRLNIPLDRRVDIKTFSATIPASASVSNVVDTEGYTIVGIEMPSGTTFAGDRFRFKAGMDNASVFSLVDAGGANIVALCSAGSHVALDGDLFNSFGYLQLLEYSGTSVQSQASDQPLTVTLIGRSEA